MQNLKSKKEWSDLLNYTLVQHPSLAKKAMQHLAEKYEIEETIGDYFSNEIEVDTQKTSSEKTYDIVFTDGSCKNNGGKHVLGGVGVYFQKHDICISKQIRDATNNIAEFKAFIVAMKKCIELGLKSVTIVTDSEYCMKCVTQWHKNWCKNGWKTAKGEKVKNKDLIVKAVKLQEEFSNIRFRHISEWGLKSHPKKADIPEKGSEAYKYYLGNKKADELANGAY